jgi:hypothetical protein
MLTRAFGFKWNDCHGVCGAGAVVPALRVKRRGGNQDRQQK